MINGKSDSVICLTKLDVLDDFDEIKVGIQYVDKTTNDILEGFPADMDNLANVEVQYKTFKGWKSDTTKIREFEKLPEEARLYLQYISEFLDVEIKWIEHIGQTSSGFRRQTPKHGFNNKLLDCR